MFLDTDVLIWAQRENKNAIEVILEDSNRAVSIQTYMELLQDSQNKHQLNVSRQFLRDLSFSILPITEQVSRRAAIYVEQFALSRGTRAADALIAATAIEHNETLCSGNRKHFTSISGLKFQHFRP